MTDINNNNKTTMLEKLKLLTYAAFAYLNVDSEPFFILMVLMCIDTLLGAVKAVRLGQKFNFRTMLIGYMMKLCFLIIPLTVALMGKALGYDFHHPVSITLSILSISEMYSILGNIYAAKNKVDIDKLDVVSRLLIALRKMMKRALDVLLDKIIRF